VKATWILAVALGAVCATAYGQDATSRQPANPRRDEVRMMEVILTNAVRTGAENLGRQLQISDPGSLVVTGTARARGFILDGYGVFFNVDVPMMKQSVIWTTQMLIREQRREFLRQFIANNADGPARRQAEMQLKTLERPTGPAPVAQTAPSGMASAQSVPDATLASGPDSRDPNELYTDAVKNSLINAMLDHSSSLKIGPDEWLIVAAQDSEGPLTNGQIYDASTIMLRIKGADLIAFQSNRITREEVLKKVDIREF
jgi:hypothetical protein